MSTCVHTDLSHPVVATSLALCPFPLNVKRWPSQLPSVSFCELQQRSLATRT